MWRPFRSIKKSVSTPSTEPSPERIHYLFERFSECFRAELLKSSNRSVFFSKTLPPEIRHEFSLNTSERAFAGDVESFGLVSQAVGVAATGVTPILFSSAALARRALPELLDRGWVHPAFNFKWVVFEAPDQDPHLNAFFAEPFVNFRLLQPESVTAVIQTLFHEHGPFLVEIPFRALKTGSSR